MLQSDKKMNVYFALRIYAMVFILRNILAQLLLFNVRFHFCGFIGPQYSINVCGFIGWQYCMHVCLSTALQCPPSASFWRTPGTQCPLRP